MTDVLVEIGLEELPSSFVAHALASMSTLGEALFKNARLPVASIETLGTARRLTLLARGVPDAQPRREETVTGPPARVAFKDGAPTKAAEGFARKQGVPLESLTTVKTDKGEYVAAHINEEGKPAKELLGPLLQELCAKVSFPKKMRWGKGDFAYGRPVHWLVALHGDKVVDFTFAEVKTGRASRGHRFLAPGDVAIDSVGSYVDALRDAHVFVVTDERREKMREGLHAAARGLGGVLVEDEFLIEENLSMVEVPLIVPGGFDEKYLELPDSVTISVMRDHQRYFAVRDAAGKLLPAYLNVVNTANAPDVIRKGNDRVLRARLDDARFFVEEDQKQKLADRRKKLDSVTFQKKLGTIGDKVERIDKIARSLGEHEDVTEEQISRAAQLAKCDLESLIVFEFPELQGQMGRFYAEHDGEAAEVARAIEEHYQPAGAGDKVPSSVLGSVIAVADRIDTLVGCFGIGQKPSGSNDPFGLRRAALGVIRVAFEGAMDIDYDRAIQAGFSAYSLGFEEASVRATIDDFFDARFRAMFAGEFTGDVVNAVLGAWARRSLRDLRVRLEAMRAFRNAPEFVPLAVAFKRAYNITKDVAPGEVDAALLEEGAEKALAEAWHAAAPVIAKHVEAQAYGDALAVIGRDLKGPIDTYFDDVFVMVDDLKLRENRLRLLKRIADAVSRIVHFHLVQTQKS